MEHIHLDSLLEFLSFQTLHFIGFPTTLHIQLLTVYTNKAVLIQLKIVSCVALQIVLAFVRLSVLHK